MGYSRRTSNNPERIALSDQTHMMSMADLVAISLETLRIESDCFLEKEFTKLIFMNLCMVLFQNIKQVDSCHNLYAVL